MNTELQMFAFFKFSNHLAYLPIDTIFPSPSAMTLINPLSYTMGVNHITLFPFSPFVYYLRKLNLCFVSNIVH